MHRLVQCFLSLVIVLGVVVVNAQSAPNAQVRVYAPKSQTSTIETFAPGGTEPKDKQDYFSGLTVAYSPDGKWVGTYGLVEGSTAPEVTYGQAGQTAAKVTLPDQSTPIRMAFSPDSKYFAYTLLNFTTQKWITGIIDLSSGKTAQFTGASNPGPVVGDATPDLNAVQGMAFPVSWSPDGKRLYVESFVYSLAAPRRFDGIYSLDFSSVDFSKSDPQALPTTQRLMQDPQIFGEPAFSPDGTKALYLTNDPQNPPDSYAPTKFSQTANTVWLLDLATGKSTSVAQAAKGEGLASTIWSLDSKSILYTAGKFQNTSYVVSPHVYSLDVASGKSSDTGVLDTDQGSYLVNMLACGDNLFAVIKVYKDDFSGDATLYSAPLSDLKSRSKGLAVAQNINLLRCTSQ